MRGPDVTDLFDPRREEQELRSYLGTRFEEGRLREYAEQLDAELERIGDEAELYRTSEAYLYNLTAFAMTGTKLPYLRELTRLVQPPARVLDYGAGIGSDGLLLLDAGYRVEFADFDNPSAEYLRWRLRERGFEASVHDVERGVPGGFDAAYAFDVIEHVPDPFAFLDELDSRAGLVCVNLLEPEPGDSPLHHDLPIADLLGRIAGRRVMGYRRFHGRSHLVLYDPRPAGGVDAIRSRARLGLGSARHALGTAVRGRIGR